MKNFSILILTFNEEKNLPNCLNSIKGFDYDVVVVDSGSTDNTKKIVKENNYRFYTNKFITQTHQINWSLRNINFKFNWILRIDADERWNSEGLKKLIEIINWDKYSAVSVKMKIFFRGKFLRFGGQSGNDFIRAFKKESYNYSIQWMDEHASVNGLTYKSKINVDEMNYDRMFSISDWTNKHNIYSIRESISMLEEKINNGYEKNSSLSKKVQLKIFIKKSLFNKLPNFIGPISLFLFRYFILLGFLDGKQGFQYAFLQSLWYRYLVNIKYDQYLKISKNNYIEALKLAKSEYMNFIK